MIGLVVVSALVGAAGIAMALSGLLQPAPTLRRTLARLHRDDELVAGRTRRADSWPAWSPAIVSGLGRVPRLFPTEAQLALLARTPEQHAVHLALGAIAGLAGPALALGALQQADLLALGWFVPAVGAAAGAALGPVLVRTAAVERSDAVLADLRYQVSAYLDVVTMLLAGNTGYEGALEQAASAGDGRLFHELRRRMRESGARGVSLTDALQRTGSELGLVELEQIAATASLSAAEGAPVARTLAAKCATLRTALATEQESEARLRTSRLTTPIVGMALIFMGLVIYPALSFS